MSRAYPGWPLQSLLLGKSHCLAPAASAVQEQSLQKHLRALDPLNTTASVATTSLPHQRGGRACEHKLTVSHLFVYGSRSTALTMQVRRVPIRAACRSQTGHAGAAQPGKREASQAFASITVITGADPRLCLAVLLRPRTQSRHSVPSKQALDRASACWSAAQQARTAGTGIRSGPEPVRRCDMARACSRTRAVQRCKGCVLWSTLRARVGWALPQQALAPASARWLAAQRTRFYRYLEPSEALLVCDSMKATMVSFPVLPRCICWSLAAQVERRWASPRLEQLLRSFLAPVACMSPCT